MSVSETIKDQIGTDTPPAPRGLAGKSYTAVFRGDRKPTQIDFEIAGHPAWVKVLRMGKDDRNQFVKRFGNVNLDGGNVPVDEMTTYLVGHTVTDFLLRTRSVDKETGEEEWIEVRPPERTPKDPNPILKFFRDRGDQFPDFWDDLVLTCSAENGFTDAAEPDQGNSPPPSVP